MTTPLVDDALLPAAAFLTSGTARDVLAPALAATGRELLTCTPLQVQYRPGTDLVVRYRVESRAADGTTERGTVLAATTATGPHPGTLPIEATTDDGTRLAVGVWQWPFDPVLQGLFDAVTPHRAELLLGGVLAGRPQLDVVVYRPTERAVVRATAGDRSVYVKVVPPQLAAGLLARHAALGAAGLPVPEVLAADADTGLLVLAELRGPTLRELVKGTRGRRPPASEVLDLRARLAAVALVDAGRASRRDDARAHAAMLASVLPDEAGPIRDLVGRIDAAGGAGDPAVTIHGDLHEGQLIVAGGRIVGLLDIDDVGPGDALDDLATLLGHLRYRAVAGSDRAGRAGLARYAGRLADGFHTALAAEGRDPAQLDVSTAAVLLGLATGPFRVQMTGWQQATRDVLRAAEVALMMNKVSASPHRPATGAAHADPRRRNGRPSSPTIRT